MMLDRSGSVGAKMPEASAAANAFVGMLVGETRRNRPHVRVRGLDGHTGLQAGDDIEEVVAAFGGLGGGKLHRHPVVDVAAEEDERRRSHTQDQVR